tara:strand:+ start:3625 stop:4380 length:756 start_codon:yes stop_codon:yes gene_type:complete
MKLNYLINKAKKLRQDTFLEFIKRGEAHLGGSFSIIEVLVILFEKILKKNDKFILSKSHSSYPLCIILRNKGFKTKMTTHLEIDPKNGIHCTTGSLGHGLPIATGMALGRKKRNIGGKIFVMISDGECQEGTTWESMLIGAKHKLKNLVVIIDYNKIQALQKINDVLPLDNLSKKILAFNWNCVEVKKGHDFISLIKGLRKKFNNQKPTAIILHTVKGKGIPEFENDPVWHARKIVGNDIILGKKKLGLIK